MLISKRLCAIAGFVTPGSRIADIGSDHALLPVYLVQQGICPSGIAGELNEGPLEAARRGIRAAGLGKAIEARRGNGLEVIRPGEADTITIAGMGGGLIRSILEEGRQGGKLTGIRELVLQPNVGEELVRLWLLEHGWLLAGEAILEEDGKYYEILHARSHPDADRLNQELYRSDAILPGLESNEDLSLRLKMGPYLLRQRPQAFADKWLSELGKLRRIVQELEKSGAADAAIRATEFNRQCMLIGEVLACSPTGTTLQD